MENSIKVVNVTVEGKPVEPGGQSPSAADLYDSILKKMREEGRSADEIKAVAEHLRARSR